MDTSDEPIKLRLVDKEVHGEQIRLLFGVDLVFKRLRINPYKLGIQGR